MKWYQTWDYRDHKNYWWTQRDQRGICFEIRKNGAILDLFMCDKFMSKHDTLQSAMDAAIAI